MSAQEVTFPASAVIRGENIRLWAEPSFSADELEILQRGDAVTITGAAVAAEGDEFYPVEFTESGQAGWVRTVFINPASLVGVQVLEPVNEAPADEARPNRRNRDQANVETPVEQTTGGEQGGDSASADDRAARRAARQAEQDAAADQANNPVPVEQVPAEETPTTLPPADNADDAPADDASQGDTAGTVTFAGEGSVTTEPVALLAGDYTVTITSEVTAPSDVVVRLEDTEEQAQRLFRESVGAQSWTAETEITIETDGDYTVRVSGLEDSWTITFEPVAA
jgi:hypothetical protein